MDNLDDVLNVTVKFFLELGYERVRVYLANEDQDEIRGARCNYLPDAKFRKVHISIRENKGSLQTLRRLLEKKPFHNPSNPTLIQQLKDKPSQDALIIPLVAGKKLVGSLSLDKAISGKSVSLKELDPRTITVTNHIALSLNRIIADAKIKKAGTELKKKVAEATENLRKIGRSLRTAKNKNDILNFTIKTFLKLGFERVRIWLIDQHKRTYSGEKCSYMPDKKFQKIQLSLGDKRLPKDYTFFLRLNKPYVNKTYPLLKKFFNDHAPPYTLEFPLIAGKQLLGLVSVDNAISKRDINVEEAEAKISPLVNHIALNLNRIVAEEKIREANRNLKAKVAVATEELQTKNSELERIANFDHLSGLPNRRYLDRRLKEEFKKVSERRTLTLAMIDVDFLKHLNDTRGHHAGDQLITQVGEVLAKDRRIDFAARFAGDEFVFLLINTSEDKRKKIFKNILRKIKKASGHTVSLGCVSAANPAIKSTIDMLRLADDALYHAKHSGRDRFVCADDKQEQLTPLSEMRFGLQAIEEQGTLAVDYINQLHAINKISEHLRQRLPENAILKRIIKSLRDDLGFERSIIYFFDEESKEFNLAIHSNFKKDILAKIKHLKKVPKLEALLKKVVRSRKAACLENKEIPSVLKMQRALIIPLIGRSSVLGALMAEYRPNRAIHQNDLDFFLTLGDQIESGLVKIRSTAAMQKFNESLKRQIADGTQKLKRYARSLEKEIRSNSALRQEEQRTHFELISALVTSLEEKDIYTRGHSVRVASHAVKLARATGMDESRVRNLRYACLLHDVGKVAIDQTILQKKTALSESEARDLEKHPVIGEKIVSGVKFLKSAARTIRHHHEKWDGSGYPDGLKRKAINLEARILTIADAYDAMVTRRSYGKKMTRAEAIRELEIGSGKQFDPKLVSIFVKLLKNGKIRTPQKSSSKKLNR